MTGPGVAAWGHGVGLRSQYDDSLHIIVILRVSTRTHGLQSITRGGALTFTSDSNHNDPPRCTATSCTSNTSLAALQLLFDGVRSVLRSECAELYRLYTAVRSVYSCNLYTVLCAAVSCHQRTSAPAHHVLVAASVLPGCVHALPWRWPGVAVSSFPDSSLWGSSSS